MEQIVQTRSVPVTVSYTHLEGGHRDGTLAQDVSNIVDVVGAFLQKQPAGEGGVPVPAVIVNAAVRHIVDGLHEMCIRDRQ